MVALICLTLACPIALAQKTSVSESSRVIRKSLLTLFELSQKASRDSKLLPKFRGNFDSALDWGALASQVVGPAEWKALKPGQQNEMLSSLKNLTVGTIEFQAPQFWRDFPKYGVGPIQVSDRSATAQVSFTGKKGTLKYTYELTRKGPQWRLSGVEGRSEEIAKIRNQVQASMKSGGFDATMQKVRILESILEVQRKLLKE